MTPTTFTDRLTYSQALVLSYSELYTRIETDRVNSFELACDLLEVKTLFSRLPILTQASAIAWVSGLSGDGCQYDRRKR